jgi:hypothetical protein
MKIAQRGCDGDHIITSRKRRENAGTRLNGGRMPFHFGGPKRNGSTLAHTESPSAASFPLPLETLPQTHLA